MAMKRNGPLARLARLVGSILHPGVLIHPFRMLHYWGYSHAIPRARIAKGRDLRIAPTASFRNGERIRLADQVQVGEYTALWAGRTTGRHRCGRARTDRADARRQRAAGLTRASRPPPGAASRPRAPAAAGPAWQGRASARRRPAGPDAPAPGARAQ